MNLKQNINRIHIELSNNFDEVNIFEKSDIKLGNYIELSILEGDKNLKLIVSKTDLEGDNFNWKYFANPLNENSDLVNRNSSISLFIEDVKDIFEKNRFNSEYINELSIFNRTGEMIDKSRDLVSNMKIEMDKISDGQITWDMADVSINVLNQLNTVLDDILSNEKLIKHFNKIDKLDLVKKIKSNVGVNDYGRNRTDGLYLGDTDGLFTKKVGDWINVNDDEAKTIIAKQLTTWLNSNIDDLLSLL